MLRKASKMQTKKDKNTMGRKLYSFSESYSIYVKAIASFSIMKNALETGIIDEKFKERLMLAVTQVNGCSLCSYGHTKYALETGMSNKEIQSFLDPEAIEKENFVPDEEIAAIYFAQHYADQRCKPTEKTVLEIKKRYGLEKANAIIATIRVISAGNAFGSRLSGIVDRIKRREHDKRTTIASSLLYILFSIIVMPIAAIHALLFVKPDSE